MKRPFEDYLAFIENELGVQLFDWQKDVLLHIYNGNLGRICFGRQCGITMLTRATLILYEEMARDAGNLPPRLYELDSDENENNNIEWKKENKL